MNNLLFKTSILFIVVIICSASTAWSQDERLLIISGATTVQPMAEQVGTLFSRNTGIPVSVSGGGSGAGLRDAVAGTSHIGMVSRALRSDERNTVNHLTAGYDALVFIVNNQNPLRRIDRGTVVELFSGRVTQWRQIADWDQSVVLVTKEVGRATLDLFEGYAELHHPKKKPGSRGSVTENSHETGANVEALMLVGGLPGAIGYVSMGVANSLVERGLPVRILALDGEEPNVANVLSGTYPIGRELNFVFTERNRITGLYLDLVLSPEGQAIVENQGFIPAGRR